MKDDVKDITLKLMDSNTFTDSEYGHIKVDISDLIESGQAKEETQKLKDKSEKEMKSKITFGISQVENTSDKKDEEKDKLGKKDQEEDDK